MEQIEDLEAALEQTQMQMQQLLEAAKEEEDKYQAEIQSLIELNKQTSTTKEQL